MNSILRVAKYQLYDFMKAVKVFYAIILLISLTLVILLSKNLEEVSFGGLGMTTAIFIFIAGLNCFTSNFKFMLANNVTRKRFYIGNIIALASVAAFMALIDTILSNILRMNFPYESIVTQLYKNNSLFPEFLWASSFYTLNVYFGWLVTMVYYRSNKIMKTVISILPILIIITFNYFDYVSGKAGSVAITGFLIKAMGLSTGNVYAGSLSLLIGAAAIAGICFALVRKAIIKY
jgi:hypothetical protein